MIEKSDLVLSKILHVNILKIELSGANSEVLL